jgi:ABC-type bacteriocin/lantibiotic exporter with double-glycine peptidase domain
VAAALFRLVEADAGRILLDGVDIASVNVYHLRSRLAIIPQVRASPLESLGPGVASIRDT